MIKNMEDTKRDAILAVADLMAAAAMTAPKGSGKDTIRTAIITGEDKDRLRDKMLKLGEYTGQLIFTRDSGNVDNSVAVVLIGCTGNYSAGNAGTPAPDASSPSAASVSP